MVAVRSLKKASICWLQRLTVVVLAQNPVLESRLDKTVTLDDGVLAPKNAEYVVGSNVSSSFINITSKKSRKVVVREKD